ncbi:vWA domain-containing protein [Phaeobacter italicus]|uniref:vWA domain-containing protein n=1 Tax=Phaeobacter italicus TaxID=481446 RepID=UPI00248D5A11|nr:VWA domain-containing protein [Phaeobacter italicus]
MAFVTELDQKAGTMICGFFYGMEIAGGEILCAPEGAAWGDWLALVILVVSVILTARAMQQHRLREAVSALTMAATAVLLAVSANGPVWQTSEPPDNDTNGLVVALVDQSESVWRDRASARGALETLAVRVQALDGELEDATWSGMVIGFSESASLLAPQQPLSRLPDMVRAVQVARPGTQSRGGLGIDRALDEIRKAGGRGQVLLVTDGLFDEPAFDEALVRAAASGIPISVLPVGSRAPGLGLISADLAPEQHINRDATVRGTVLGGGTLRVTDPDLGQAEVDIVGQERAQPVHVSKRFAARGLQHLKIAFDTGDTRQERVLYTLVRGPAQVLLFGDGRGFDALDPAAWSIHRAQPDAAPDPDAFDLVVIDALPPSSFPGDYSEKLLNSASRTGILLINGGLRGSVEDPQVIGDWNGTALSPILPVDSDPRSFILDPPGRDIVILIDVSGSMESSLGVAKTAAFAVLEQLRLQDSIAVLAFSDITERTFDQRPATRENLDAARLLVNGLTAGGGTAPGSTLERAARMRSNYCAYFFISDGVFDVPKVSPQCYTTALSTEGAHFPKGVADWGEEIMLNAGQGVGQIKMDYFEPEQRKAYFRPDWFRPIAAGTSAPLTGYQLPGIAIAYPRIDAEVLSLHDTPPPDPVLVYRRDPDQPGTATGVFLSALPDAVSPSDLQDVLARLLGWSRPNRFDIRAKQTGNQVTVSVLTLAQPDDQSLPESVSGTLRIAGQGQQPLSFRPSGPPGRFETSLTLRMSDEPLDAELILSEPGRDDQIIPATIPARSPRQAMAGGDERFDSGIDAEALSRMITITGGRDLRVAAPRVAEVASSPSKVPLHALTICLALFSLGLALWVKGRPN